MTRRLAKGLKMWKESSSKCEPSSCKRVRDQRWDKAFLDRRLLQGSTVACVQYQVPECDPLRIFEKTEENEGQSGSSYEKEGGNLIMKKQSWVTYRNEKV